ncbi:hypothetical protein [Shewanella sp.]|nr:hypothetical protein [Shewanella sp.]
MKHATANTFKPASINVEPSDIVPLTATETPSTGNLSQELSQQSPSVR